MTGQFVLGIDPALNHAGLVLLDGAGALAWACVVTDQVGVATRRATGVSFVLMPHTPRAGLDSDQVASDRLLWWDAFARQIIAEHRPAYVAIEDYGFATKGPTFSTGEVGGALRLAALRSGARLRLVDPPSVKLFATGRGDATGREVADAVGAPAARVIFASANPPAKAGRKPNTLPEEDLAAAWVVARMAWMEVELRAGRPLPAQLSEAQLRYYNRVTAGHAVNVLGRDWLRSRDAAQAGGAR